MVSADELRSYIDVIQTAPFLVVAIALFIACLKLYPSLQKLITTRAQILEEREQRKLEEHKERAARDAKYDSFIISLEPIIKGFSSVVENNTEAMKQNKATQEKVSRQLEKIESSQTKHLETLTKINTVIDRCHRGR